MFRNTSPICDRSQSIAVDQQPEGQERAVAEVVYLDATV